MIYILYGNIASGKSTFCKEKAKDGAIIVNDDSIVSSLHGGNYLLYDINLKPLYKKIEEDIIMSSVRIGRDVVIDRPNKKRKTRKRYASLAKYLNTESCLVCFTWEKPEVHAERRVKSDSRGYTYEYWFEVAKYIQENSDEIDTQKEFYDKIIGK